MKSTKIINVIVFFRMLDFMKVVTIANRKGGSGKSTCAANFAVEAFKAGLNVAMLDMDPQRTLTSWWEHRETVEPAERIAMFESPHSSKIASTINALSKKGYDICFIDTPGYSDDNALMSVRSADLVVIPCRPIGIDLHAASQTIAIASKEKKQTVFVFSQVPPNTNFKELLPIVGVLSKSGYVAPEIITTNKYYAIALSSGKSVDDLDKKRGQELKKIWEYIRVCVDDDKKNKLTNEETDV